MNLMTANRLQQLRKANGYSQEVLAEKLGVSRQSVSKWERGEASPEIDNLMALAKIYGITIDDLLSTDNKEIEQSAQTELDFSGKLKSLLSKANDFGIYPNTAKKLTKFPFPIFIVAIYFTLSIIFNMWHPFWIVFMTIPIFYRFAIACKANNKKVFAVLLPVPELIVTIYLLAGVLFGWWKYASVLFFLIPLYFWAIPFIKHSKTKIEAGNPKQEKRVYVVLVTVIIVLLAGITAISYVCRYDNDTENFSKITVGDARTIALEDANNNEDNVVFTKQEREREHGIYAYEIEFNDGITKYEYNIDAKTGEILSQNSEKIY